MDTNSGARPTVIAVVIGMAAGFAAVALVFGLSMTVGLLGRPAAMTAIDTHILPLIPCLCLSVVLGFSVWLQAWTRGLSYRWLSCTLSSLAGALVAGGGAWLLVWLLGWASDSLLSEVYWLPVAAGLAGDFGGVALLLGLRERRVKWFLLPALGLGVALALTCWRLMVAESLFAMLFLPVAPVAYFTVFHVFLDLLWRDQGDAAKGRTLRIARWSLVGTFVGLPLLWSTIAFAAGPNLLESDSLIQGDTAALKEALAKNPKLLTAVDHMGDTLLHRAASEGATKAVEMLIEKGADVNCVSRFGGTPLHSAVKGQTTGNSGGGTEVVALLLKHKADPNVVSSLGDAPLHIACEANQDALVEVLLRGGANVNQPDGALKRTALHEAAKQGRMAVAEVLLKHGADVNAQDYTEARPLHDAVANNQLAMVELLIKNGADTNAESRTGGRPLDIALKKNLPKIAELLRANGAQEKAAPKR